MERNLTQRQKQNQIDEMENSVLSIFEDGRIADAISSFNEEINSLITPCPIEDDIDVHRVFVEEVKAHLVEFVDNMPYSEHVVKELSKRYK